MYNTINMIKFSQKLVGLVFAVFGVMLSVHGQGQIYSTYSNKVTQVSSNTPTTPAGSGTTFFVGREMIWVLGGPSISFNYRSLIQFDFSNIDPNAVVISATLTLTRSGGINPMQIITARATSPWTESTATWNNQPAYQSSDQITTTAPNTSMTIDVTNHVQNMVAGVYPNNGWVLRGSVESGSVGVNRHFYSDHYSIPTSHPRLDITYYIPMSVSSATVSHESQLGANDGSVSPVLVNGPGGTYTYNWINSSGNSISTSPNLTGVAAGWYGLQVSSSIAGTIPFYYAFLVGRNCAVVPITFNPGPNYIDDAMLNDRVFSSNNFRIVNYGSYAYNLAYEYTNLYDQRTLMRFRLWVDPDLVIDEAQLKMVGDGHIYSSTRNNQAEFAYVTEDWNEQIVTHSIIPTYNNSQLLLSPTTTSTNQNLSIDSKSFWDLWKNDNTLNFGMLFKLSQYINPYESSLQRYHSSDAAIASNHPKIDFLISLAKPVAPHYCNQMFAKMDRNLRGVRYKPDQNHLYFYYEEEYNSPNAGLNYRVYGDNNPMTTLIGHTTQPLTEIEYGDNRYVLNVSQLPSGFYILEIINNKKEKYYLRFKIED